MQISGDFLNNWRWVPPKTFAIAKQWLYGGQFCILYILNSFEVECFNNVKEETITILLSYTAMLYKFICAILYIFYYTVCDVLYYLS